MAITTNQTFSQRFAINPATAVTCVKPSGTVSLTVDSASGMHPRYAPYYLRRVRLSARDPLLALLKSQSIPCYPEVGQVAETANTFVVEFPVKSPAGAICRRELTALDQLQYWQMLKENFTEHNPSVTIYVDTDEWETVYTWIKTHWNIIGGLSFLPLEQTAYQLAPYEEISAEDDRCHQQSLNIDFSKLSAFEHADQTEMKRINSCEGSQCEIVSNRRA